MKEHPNKTLITKLVLASLAITTAPVLAQDEPIEEVVVTGTATARSAFDTPLSITSFNEDKLRTLSSNSQADILRTVPGINAEGGGGEVAANVRITGLPSGGQYAFTPLQFDGIPLFSTFGLNSSAFDVYGRPDMGLERMEFVRGGVSNLFGAGSVAGIINYISKTGSDERESSVQVEVGEEGRQKYDFATSGPLGGGNYYALSGYYRDDEGPLETGLDTKGYQLRGNILRDFDDGSGSLKVFAQLIDDEVQFFLPYPLNGNDFSRPRGNDGKTIFSLQTADAANLSFQTPNGVYETAIADGVVTEGASLGFALEKDIGSGWTLNSKVKYAEYDHEFNLFLDGDGIVTTPVTPEDYLDSLGVGTVGVNDLQNASFTFVGGGAVPSTDLVFGNRILDRQRDAEDLTAELSFTKTIDIGNLEHNFTIGAYYADAEAEDINYIFSYLGEFRDQPRLINVEHNGVVLSNGGLTNTNGQTSSNLISAKKKAIYLADQIEADRWNFDIGLRIEEIDGDISKPQFGRVAINAPANFSENLSSAGTQIGAGNSASVSDSAVAVAIAGIYRITDELNFFGNISDGFFFPELRNVRFRADGSPFDYGEEKIFRVQAGLKYSGEKMQASASLIRVELDDRLNFRQENDPNNPGSLIELVNEIATETNAFEVDATYFLDDRWTINGNLSYQDPEFVKYDGVEQRIGNEPARNPRLAWNLGVSYNDGKIDASLFNTHTGDAFTNDENNVELEAFDLLRLDAGYSMDLANDSRLRLGISVFNLTDEEGITEGSPREGSAQSNTGNFFVGRPILPRRAYFRVTYDF